MTTRPSELRCPACGETDLLNGRPVEDGIELICGGCRHTWRREQRACATCGGSAVVERDQYLSRNPRGNQIAVVGRRLIRLCPDCDKEALTLADRRSGMVEQDYVSRYLIDRRALPTLAPRQPTQPTRPRESQRSPADRDEASPTGRRTPASRTLRAHALRSAPARVTSMDPTLREAISSFLEGPAEPGDAFVMLLVGRALGPSTRLSTLGPTAADRLFRAGGGSASARECAARALAHWRSQGWPL